MERISIMTPTYNRGYILKNAYRSLLRQTNSNFVWLIIDDGSTDDTEIIVNKWIQDNKIKIEYYKKQNGGKHSAINYAIDVVKTEYMVIALDSDDYFTDDAVECILKNIDKKKSGLVFLCDDEKRTGKYKKKYDINKLKRFSIGEAISLGLFNASAIFVFKTEYIKKYKFPIIEGEKFFNEGYMIYKLEEPVVWIDDVLCIREFKDDGLTKNIFKTYLKNPNSWYLYNKLRFEKSKKCKSKIKYKIYEISFGIIANKRVIVEAKNKILTTVLFPIGWIGSKYLRRSEKR